MSNMIHISASPHIRSKMTTSKLMYLVIIALLPTTVFGIYHFGKGAVIVLLSTVISSVLTEYLYEKAMKKPVTIKDGSAFLTGLLLGLNMPSTAPWWVGVLGGVFAILVVKQVFGGLGQNFMNPALGARCFLVLSFTNIMTNFPQVGNSTATPLAALKAGEAVNTRDMLLGFTSGTIGETSTIALLIGAIILLWFEVIDIVIPGLYILTFVIFITIFGGHGLDATYITAQLCGGGLMLGAWFMATDYVTSPITPRGRIIYAVLLGVLTGLFRLFGASAEGVSFAIIIGNVAVPVIEKYTIPKAFGYKKGGRKS